MELVDTILLRCITLQYEGSSPLNSNKYIALKLIKWTAFMEMSGVYINPILFSEANYYCEESIDLWKQAKGSIDWLLKNVLK